jgi:hypothetical protein
VTTPLVVTDRDDNRHYTHPITGQVMVSVTTVISMTQSKPWLAPWQVRLTLEWALANLHLLDDGTLSRIDFVRLAKDAGARARDIKADTGQYAHDVIEALILWAATPGGSEIALPVIPDHLVGQYMDGPPEPGETGILVEDFADVAITGFTAFVTDFDPQFTASSMPVFHPELGVAGTLDFMARFLVFGDQCVDVKTGKHLTDVQEQLAAYRRMTECQLPLGQVEPMPPTDGGMVLHLRPEYRHGYRLMQVPAADDVVAWNSFRRALLLTQERSGRKPKPGRVLYPPLPDGSQPLPLLVDLDGEVHGRVRNPLIREIGDDTRVGDLTGFTDDDLLAVKGLGPKALGAIDTLLADYGLTRVQKGEVA